MLAESNYLQQARTVFQAESISRLDDLMRGFDFQVENWLKKGMSFPGGTAGRYSCLQGIEEVKKEQARLEEEKADFWSLSKEGLTCLNWLKWNDRCCIGNSGPSPKLKMCITRTLKRWPYGSPETLKSTITTPAFRCLFPYLEGI